VRLSRESPRWGYLLLATALSDKRLDRAALCSATIGTASRASMLWGSRGSAEPSTRTEGRTTRRILEPSVYSRKAEPKRVLLDSYRLAVLIMAFVSYYVTVAISR
jgi:hypothetical protein